ncbi:MAG: carbohydrate ABC transporter permease [Ktedonobacteraceae bacterium]
MQKQQQLEAEHSTVAVSTMKQKRVPMHWYRWRQRVMLPYLFLTPFLILFLLFFILPLGYALGISLFADRLVGGTVFVGGQNYLQAFQDGSFWEGVRRTLLFMVVQVPVMLCLALLFALILDSGVAKLRTLFRLGFFLPYAIPSVVSALLWGYLYSPSFGPFAQVASSLHLPAPGFLTDSGMLASIGNIVTWQWTGYNMIIMYAALQAISPELYEAALVDGATGWKVARYIKIPLIAPALVLTCVFSIIGSLQLFNEPQIMGTIAPTVIQDHYTPNLYAYTLAFTNQQYNYSAAISFTLGAIVFVCSYIFMLATNRRGLR